MPGEFYFMAIAGLGLSFAGFAGVIAALDRRPSSPMSLWRIIQIVRGGFILVFAGFATVMIYTATGENLTATVRLSSLALAVLNTANVVIAQRPGPAWPSERGRRYAQIASWSAIGVLLLNAVIGRFALLQFMFLAQIADPASIFFNAVRDVARGASAADGQNSSDSPL